MASSLSASLIIKAQAELVPSSPAAGAVLAELSNATGGTFWTPGQGSGQIDRVYLASVSLTSGQTVNYNTLAAGSLLDALGQAIDLDELKGLVVKCNTGSIKIDAPAANFIGIFSDASDLIRLTAGHVIAFDFSAAGLDVTTNSKWDIVETASSTASYTIMFWGAQ